MEIVQPQSQAEIQLVEIVFELNIGFFLNNRENNAHFVLKIIQGLVTTLVTVLQYIRVEETQKFKIG